MRNLTTVFSALDKYVTEELDKDMTTMNHPAALQIVVIPGDGIGREVVPAAVSVLELLGSRFGIPFEFQHVDWGSEYYLQHGSMMPPDALEVMGRSKAVLLGAIGHPDVPDHLTLNGLLLPIRRSFRQYVNLRPAILYPGVASPLVGVAPGTVDMIIVRENTEGEYAQVGGFVHHHESEEVAVQTSIFTRVGVERVIRFAFELAMREDRRKKVTSITKSNAQAFGMVLWDRVFNEVKAEYPDVETESLLVDAATIHLVRRPQTFDVIVASNLFGDILSDLAAGVTGSIGLAPSANLDPTRRYPSMFEPVHGSAPDIAGKGLANPLATFLSSAMMLEHLGFDEAAKALHNSVRHVLKEAKVKTADLGGRSSTQEVTDAVVQSIAAWPTPVVSGKN
jgi:tartrate dehydrogenase/decarboxylase/D-malate dehydrogenase